MLFTGKIFRYVHAVLQRNNTKDPHEILLLAQQKFDKRDAKILNRDIRDNRKKILNLIRRQLRKKEEKKKSQSPNRMQTEKSASSEDKESESDSDSGSDSSESAVHSEVEGGDDKCDDKVNQTDATRTTGRVYTDDTAGHILCLMDLGLWY